MPAHSLRLQLPNNDTSWLLLNGMRIWQLLYSLSAKQELEIPLCKARQIQSTTIKDIIATFPHACRRT